MKKNILAVMVILLTAVGCQDQAIHAKIKPYEVGNKNAFIFSIDEEFLRNNQNSPKDEDYPKMTKAEVALLKRVLQKNNYCTGGGRPSFVINSRQEKIYDITFSHLIEQNYNAKPVAPRTYFGECKF